MNVRRVLSMFVMFACAVQAALVLAQSTTAPPRPAAPAPAAAIVGSTRISTADLDRRTVAAIAELSRRSGDGTLPTELRDLVRRQVLEGLIRQELLTLEARRLGITAAPGEAEAILKQESFFNPGGRFDEQRFQAVKSTQRAQYDAAIALIESQLAGRKLGEQVTRKYAPSEASARQRAIRSLTRASVDYFALARADFDGGFPEPRESDVVSWYRSHPAEFERTDRAVITVAFVNTPGLTETQHKDPAALEAWNRRMKVVADSLLGEIARGGSFESVAGYLSPRAGIVVASDNFPGYWHGTAAQSRRVFDPRNANTVIPEAVAGEEGWLLVKVTSVQPAHVAPLREVAREIRQMLRRERKAHAEDRALQELYAGFADSLAAPGWRVRWAVFESGAARVPEPTPAELDRFYRGHLADYSAFDATSGNIAARPLAEVKTDVREAFLRDAKARAARLAADQTQRAWASGKRDPAAEAVGKLGEAASPEGADFDSTRWGQVVADSVWAHDPPRGGMTRVDGAWIVWQPLVRVERVLPTFAQTRGALVAVRERNRRATDEAGARRLFDADPRRFALGNVIRYTRVIVTPPNVLKVPLTRAEVENFHRENIADYSAPELVRASHILVEPKSNTPDDDAAARRLAEQLLARANAGEDFSALAREYSADVATKDKGGDLGVFQRGTLLQSIEDAAFASQAGDIVPRVVRSEVGYHVIRVTEHVPAVVQPLQWLYSAVSSDAAYAKGERLAKATADSMLRVARRPADILRLAQQKGYTVLSEEHKIGESIGSPEVEPLFAALDRMRPGELMPSSFAVKGQGYWLVWVDSILPIRLPKWDEARPRAIEAYQRGAGERALLAKQAELDSLEATGWSVDSLAALWAGPEHVRDLSPGAGIPGLGSVEAFDSLTFGTDRAPAIALGQWTTWSSFANALTRLRVVERPAPSPAQVGERAAGIRNAEAELGMRDWFEDAKKRWPVRILEPKMRDLRPASPNTAATTPTNP